MFFAGCCFLTCLSKLLVFLVVLYIICYIGCSLSTTFQYYARFIAYYFLLIFTGFLCMIFVIRPRHVENLRIMHTIIRCVARILKISVEVSGFHYIQNDEPMVLICNHQSSIDVLGAAFIWPKRCTVLAKKSLLYAGPIGISAWLSHTIFIDRGNREHAMRTMNKTAKYIKDTKIKMFIFPEGTRRCGTTLQPFKKGAFHLAVEGQLPIVPIVFSSYRPFLDHSKKLFTEGKFKVDILPPIDTTGKTKNDIDSLVEVSRNQMIEVFEDGIAREVTQGVSR